MNRLTICLAVLPGFAFAQSDPVDVMIMATNLGSIIGSESYCDLTYDQDAIASYIAQNVPADAMDFPSTLSMMIQGSSFQNQSLSVSGKTAHCASVTQTAKHFGFLK